jgi:hypothetical protein
MSSSSPGLWRRISPAGILPMIAAAVCLEQSFAAVRGGFSGTAMLRGALVASLGLALGAAVLLRPALRARLTALIVSTAASLYGAEALLRAFTPTGISPVARVLRARAAGVHYDVRDQLEVVTDLRRGGVAAYPAIPPRALNFPAPDGTWRSPIHVGEREIFPLSGIAQVHTVLDNESGRYAEYESDEHGFNNPAGRWAGAPVSVVLVGDSFTQGCGVPPEQNLTAPVRARFPRTVNLGIASSGPLTALGELREYGALLRPRVVLWNYFGNDLDDLNGERRTLLVRYLEPDFRQDLVGSRAEIDRQLMAIVGTVAATELSTAARVRRFVGLHRLRNLAGVGTVPVPTPPDVELFRRVLRQGRLDVEAWGGRLVFVYLPSWQHYAHKPLDERHDEVLAVARDLGLETLDLREVFDREPDPLELFPYRLGGHYNARGYRIAGEALAARLVADGLAPD